MSRSKGYEYTPRSGSSFTFRDKGTPGKPAAAPRAPTSDENKILLLAAMQPSQLAGQNSSVVNFPQQQAPATGMAALGGAAGSAAAGPGKSTDPFQAAIDHVNQMYDQQHAHLDTLTGNAKAGVNQVGSDVMSRLAALATDAKGANAKTDKSIADTYKTAQGNQSAEYGQLLADLQRQGAGTQTLGSEERARQGALSSASARQSSTSDRYSQLLDQSLNSRNALSKQTTGNSLNDLTRAEEGAVFSAQQAKVNAIYQIQQQKAQHDAAMAAAAASARRSGGGGGSSKGGLSLANVISLLKMNKGQGAKGKGADYGALLDKFTSKGQGQAGIDMSNPMVANIVNGYLSQVSGGGIKGYTFGNALNNWNSTGQQGVGIGNDQLLDITNFLNAGQRQQSAASQANAGYQPTAEDVLAFYSMLGG